MEIYMTGNIQGLDSGSKQGDCNKHSHVLHVVWLIIKPTLSAVMTAKTGSIFISEDFLYQLMCLLKANRKYGFFRLERNEGQHSLTS